MTLIERLLCECGKPLLKFSSFSTCDYCGALWTKAYQAGQEFERQYGAAADALEAKDAEIERLRGKIEVQRAISDQIQAHLEREEARRYKAEGKVDRLRAEITRLRSILEEVF